MGMILCNRCGGYFNIDLKPGAILFSHPEKESPIDKVGKVSKYHICRKCEKIILKDFRFAE